MSTLLVTPFAPYRDGIATYAVQELRRLRQNGDRVEVLSPLPSAARWHLRLGGPAGMAKLARKAGRYDTTVVQFGPELAFGSCRSAGQRVAVWAALAATAKRTSLDLRIHEIEYGPLEQNPWERAAARLALEHAHRVTVHTEAERSRLQALIGLGRRIEIVEHGRDFQARVEISREEARTELSIPPDQFAFVAIGFLQHHKGFDRAIEAMAALQSENAHLHVVGSARVDHPDIVGYVEQLDRACAGVHSATLHRRFVSDVEFDLWLRAADAVVLPYREIWSSGVIERARLYDTPILASDLPQLRDQAPDGTLFFTDVDELCRLMEKLSSSTVRPVGAGGDQAGPDHREPAAAAGASPWRVDRQHPDRMSIEAQIVARARTVQIEQAAERDRPAENRRPVDCLLALGDLHRPQPTSARPGVAPAKRLIDRLIGWQIEPLATRLEDLQRATVEAVAQLDRGIPLGPNPSQGPSSIPGPAVDPSGLGGVPGDPAATDRRQRQ